MFPEPIWDIIKSYMLDKEDYLMELIDKMIPRLPYKVKLSFYYQAKYQFRDFLEQWFEKNLKIIEDDRMELLSRGGVTSFELWTLNHLNALKTNLTVKREIYSRSTMCIDETAKDLSLWFSIDIPQWTKTPMITFLLYCKEQREKEIMTFDLGTYHLQGYVEPPEDFILTHKEIITRKNGALTLIYAPKPCESALFTVYTKDGVTRMEYIIIPFYDKYLAYELKGYPVPKF